nr:hypothetical protein CPGR_01592 [Mycolicibacter nonchromogenicus]
MVSVVSAATVGRALMALSVLPAPPGRHWTRMVVLVVMVAMVVTPAPGVLVVSPVAGSRPPRALMVSPVRAAMVGSVAPATTRLLMLPQRLVLRVVMVVWVVTRVWVVCRPTG